MQGIHARFRKAGPNATRASVASECGKILLANGVSESVILPCEARMYCIVYHRYTYEVCVSDSPLEYYVLDDWYDSCWFWEASVIGCVLIQMYEDVGPECPGIR